MSSPSLSDEIALLVATLHATEERLEALTHGQIDSVLDGNGQPFLLPRAQAQVRRTEAARQAAILNALPAHIALLDRDGRILTVNETWRRFALVNGLWASNAVVGSIYLDVYDRTDGDASEQSRSVAAGIRGVLNGTLPSYTVDYECNAQEKDRRFMLIVTPLSHDPRDGAVVVHLDITARTIAENALQALSLQTQQRERTLNTVLSSISDFAYIFDRQGKFLFVNQPLLDLWQIPLEQAVGKDFFELGYPPDLAAKLMVQVESVFMTRQVVRDETTYIDIDGVDGSFEYIFLPVVADGAVEHVVGSTRDITARNRAAVALAESEREQRKLAVELDRHRLRLLEAQRMAKVRIWETDLSTMALSWPDDTSSVACAGDSALPSSHDAFLAQVHPDDRAFVNSTFKASLLDRHAGPSGHFAEHRLRLPDGRIKFMEQRWHVLFDENHVATRVIGTCQDITERRQSEMALRESQERLRDIFDGLAPSMFVALLTPEGILVEVNRSPMEAAGLKIEEVLGKHLADTYWWSHSFESQQQLREAITRGARGEASRYDVRIRGAGAIMIDIDFSLQPLRDDSGRVTFLIPSANVITERKQAEAALRESQKLEAIGQLAAGVAHEFNNILQTLLSMVTITRLRGLDPDMVKVGAEMETQILRGARVTQQLLLVARNQEPTRMSLDLHEQVAKASDLLRRLIPENIRLIVESSVTAAPFEGDASQIQQVLLNLAINARDAMAGGGTLTLRVQANGSEVSVEVEDTGSGFDDTTRERIFEPFFTTKEIGKGTGLGLAVVFRIIEEHKGHIEVQSRLGMGSLFRVILPQTASVSRFATSELELQIPTATGKILLVEDEEIVREGLTILLEMAGYTVTAMASGEDAIALPLSPAPDVLLSDVSLPGIGGSALAEILRTRWPALRITLMSGHIDPQTRARSREGGWHILQKPFALGELCDHLALTLEQSARSV